RLPIRIAVTMQIPAHMQAMFSKRSRLLGLAGALWLAAVAAGLSVLLNFENEPGLAAATAPSQWPAESRLKPAADRPTLLLFAHPLCSCTRATIGELALLMAQTQGL